MNAIRGTFSCSRRFHKRLVSVCFTDPSPHQRIYHTTYDSLSIVEVRKRRCQCFLLSTSTVHEERADTPANASQENVMTRSQRAIFEAEAMIKRDVGSFNYPQDYHVVYDWINGIIGDDTSSSKAINVSVLLLERVVREYSHYLALNVKDIQSTHKVTKDESLWFCNPFFVASVFSRWKDAAIRNEDVLSPRDMVQKLQNMSILLPAHFRYEIATMNIIMHALIRKEPLHRAPFVAENLFDFIAAEASARAVHGDTSMQPSSHTYSLVLHAWSQSRLSNAAEKMERIMATVHNEFCSDTRPRSSKDIVPYTIWMRYWSNLGNVEKVDAIMALLDGNERLRAKVDSTILSHVIFCYTKAGQLSKAESMYDRMISLGTPSMETTNSAESIDGIDSDLPRGLMLGSFYLIDYYRQVIVSIFDRNYRVFPQSLQVQIHQNTERAEAVLRQVEEYREIDPRSVDKMRKTLMDIYALSKRLDLVESMFYTMDHPFTDAHNILIKAYGKNGQPEKAEEVVQRMLANPFSAQPRIETINSLLNAWADATNHPHAADRAYKIFRAIYDDSRFVELKLRPNVITYTTLLKCWAAVGNRNPNSRIAEKVEATLKELEERFHSGDTSCKPDVQLYTMAIKAFLSVGDVMRAEAMLQRLEQSPEFKPTIRTYSEFLNYYARNGRVEGAKRAEEVLDRLRTLQSSNPSLRPNSYAFNIVLNAWATSGCPDAADRMWKIYEKQLADKVELDHVCADVLIKVFSSSKRPVDLKRSLLVLRSVNESKRIQVSNRTYSLVLKGCMTLNDNDTAAHVLTLLIEACASGRCRLDDAPDRAKFNWIITKWLSNEHLVKATIFIEGLLRLTTIKKNMVDLVGLGPDLSTVLDLRKAWTVSSHPEKADYVAKLDGEIIPAIVRTLNIEKGNVQRS